MGLEIVVSNSLLHVCSQCSELARVAREHVTVHIHCINGQIQICLMCYRYNSFRLWTFIKKQEILSMSNQLESHN